MGTNWLKNMIGLPMTFGQTEDIPYPKFELTIHVTTKTIQAGAFLGMLVAAPIASVISGNRDMSQFQHRSLSYGMKGAAIGAALGPILTALKVTSSSDLAIYDRCLRIRYNRNQVRVDRAFMIGGAVGDLAARQFCPAACKSSSTPLQPGEAALTGAMTAMLGAFAYNMIHGNKHT